MDYFGMQRCPRAKSTKTRIETADLEMRDHVNQSPRAKSTKTRIETSGKVQDATRESKVHGQNPLKQGLKLMRMWVGSFRRVSVHGQNPLKQGLKLPLTSCKGIILSVHGQNPLKQGLKLLGMRFPPVPVGRVHGQNPLKQGLKHTPST